MEPRVVPFGLDQRNLVEAHDPAAIAAAHEDPLESRWEARVSRLPGGRGQGSARTPQRCGEALCSDGLDQIIEGTDLKGMDRIFIVSGREDDGGDLVQLLQEIKSAATGHFNIEKQNIGWNPPDRLQRFLGVRRFANDFHLGVRSQKAAQSAPRQPLVIDDHRSHAGGPPQRAGITISARTPSSPAGASNSEARSPYIRRNRSRALSSPTATELSAVSSNVPVLVTSMRSFPSTIAVTTSSSPPAGRGAIPCLTPFSTRVCNSIGGNRAVKLCRSMSKRVRNRSSKRTFSSAR